jgi:hypothetical protein
MPVVLLQFLRNLQNLQTVVPLAEAVVESSVAGLGAEW